MGLLILGASAAQGATIESAAAAYQKRDFPAAYREFSTLAHIGNGVAQYNLGVMLLNGEGVARNVREGYAWLLCAQDHGVGDAEPLIAQIAAQVKPEVSARARECVAAHGREAAEALVPRLPPLDDWNRQSPPVSMAAPSVVFPESAKSNGRLGWVDTEITVGADGRVHDVWIVEAFPAREFEAVTLDAIRGLRYAPAKVDGRATPVSLSVRWRFGFDGEDARDIRGIHARLRQLAEESRQGSRASQYVFFRLAQNFPELREGVEWRTWGQQAIDGQFAAALFNGGYCPLTARGECLVPDRAAGLEMVRRVAVLGEATAQLALGRLALAEGSEEGLVRARRWLEAANVRPNPWASRYLAAALLSSGDASKRDGARALALIEPLLKHPLLADDPGVWEVAAAAYAETARGADAVAAQDKAILKAQRYGWEVSELAARRRSYLDGGRAAGPLLVVAWRPARSETPDALRRPEICDESPRTGSRVRQCSR